MNYDAQQITGGNSLPEVDITTSHVRMRRKGRRDQFGGWSAQDQKFTSGVNSTSEFVVSRTTIANDKAFNPNQFLKTGRRPRRGQQTRNKQDKTNYDTESIKNKASKAPKQCRVDKSK